MQVINLVHRFVYWQLAGCQNCSERFIHFPNMLISQTTTFSSNQLSKGNFASWGQLQHSCAYVEGEDITKKKKKRKALNCQALGLLLIELQAAKPSYTLSNFRQLYDSYYFKSGLRKQDK